MSSRVPLGSSDDTYDEAESTRLFLARLRGEEFDDANEYVADYYTPHDEYKGNA